MPRECPVLVIANHDSFPRSAGGRPAVSPAPPLPGAEYRFSTTQRFGNFLRQRGFCVPVDQEGCARE